MADTIKLDKIEFKNLPSGNTPVNDENLNTVQDNVEKFGNVISTNAAKKDKELEDALVKQEKELNDLKLKHEQIMQDYEKKEVQGESIHINDSLEYDIPISINGGIEQEQRQGYNHLQVTLETQTVNGLNLTVREDKSVTVKGTPTASTSKKVGQATLEAGTYTIYCKGMKYAYGVSRIEIRGTEVTDALYLNRESAVITLTEQDTIIMDVIGVANQVLDYTFFPMILEGNVTANLPTYEQFGAMPSLPFPSEAKGVSGHYDTVVENKNRLSKENLEQGSLANNFGGDRNPTSNTNRLRTKKPIIIKPNEDYTISIKDGYYISIREYDDKGKIVFASTNWSSSNIITKKATATTVSLDVLFKRADEGTITVEEIEWCQIELGSTATPYTPHQEQNLPIDIPFNMYSGKPYKENGKWYRPIEWGKYVFTGDEWWTLSTAWASNITNVFYAEMTINAKFESQTEVYQKSNYFKGASRDTVMSNEEDLICYSGSMNEENTAVTIRIDKTVATTANDFKAWLKEKYNSEEPVYMVYQLAKPYAEEITDTTLIAQLEELQKAKSYYEVTNINSYGNEDAAPLVLSGEYVRSNKHRIENIEKAILSLGGNV